MKLEYYIEKKENQFSSSQRKISSFLLSNKERAAMMTIQELAAICQVSTATISRFVKILGFPSYGVFQEKIQEEVLTKISTVEKIRNSSTEGEGCGFIHSALSRDRLTIEVEETELKEQILADAVNHISKASCVYLAGLGSSKALIDFLNYRFCWMGIPTRKLTVGGNEFMEQLVFLSKTDVLVNVGFRKTYKEIGIAMEYARKKGCCRIGMAEDPMSEIAKQAEYFIPIKRGPENEWNSLAYPMAVCNILVRQVLKKRKEQAIKTANELQWLNDRLK